MSEFVNLRPIVHTSAGVAAAASLSVLLAACGSSSNATKSSTNADQASKSASPSATACSTFSAGAASNAVSVSGAYNATPSIKLTGTPSATKVERTVISTGKGAMPASTDTANIHMTLFNASGSKIAVQDTQVQLSNATSDFLRASLLCSPYGSRVVVAAPASAVFASNVPSSLKATDTLFLVSDLVSKWTPPAPPKPSAWTTQVPTVAFDASGKPTVKLVGKPMPQFALKVLRPGTGAVVRSGDYVTINYQGTDWNTHAIFDQSYGRGAASFSTTEVVKGFAGALVGQKVGTRLIVTMPPKLGYGTAKTSNGLGGHTLVFVIEIEKTQANP